MPSATLIGMDQIREAVFNIEIRDELINEWGLDEVYVGVNELKDALSAQLALPSDDREWRRRAGYLSSKVDSCLRDVKSQIRERNRAETATVEAVSKKYGDFALALARALYLADDKALRAIPGPGDADITAEDWLHLRLAQQARKNSPTS